ncbi:Enhancer of mRNA-decapping protein 4 [Hondaea fermentalgiana]|uniref:Enhancer of mRNA-decapping protein 4 n=1 Tax=Hondaea fermentalgiana TaxID=2315210 RepID=A0A2R5GUH5_9STRA|nr:Enhancer of mRNA-decapping protein 4 [Hondaea fermentalgiana]|eukprot:GBG32313.1 Enhancer of mRNA-decapping protein 4 [Hondaea fermentalgiana]
MSRSESEASNPAAKMGMPPRATSSTALQVFAKASTYTPGTPTRALKATTIALVKKEPANEGLGARVASSAKFINYANKASMVRVIHTESVQTGLLRGHAEPIVDMKFCPNQDSLVATVSTDGLGIVWELRHVAESGKVEYREAIRVRTTQPNETFGAVEWHAKNQRVFALIHGGTVSVVMLSSKLWNAQQAAGREGLAIEKVRCAYAQVAQQPGVRVLSASFSADGNTLLVGCSDGTVCGLNASSLIEDAESPELGVLWQLSAGDGLGVSLCRFLQHGDHFLLTGVRGNTLLRLWTWDSSAVKYKPSHELTLADAGPLYSAAVDSSGQYVFVGIPQRNVLLCSKLNSSSVQLDRPVEYELDCPVLSFSTRRAAPDSEIILCQQTKGIQFFSFSPSSDYEQQQVPRQAASSPAPAPQAPTMRDRQDSGLMRPDQLQHQEQQQPPQQQQQQQQPPPQQQQQQQQPQQQYQQHAPQQMYQQHQQYPSHFMANGAGLAPGGGGGGGSGLEEALSRHLGALESRQKQVSDAQSDKFMSQQKSLLQVLAKSLGEIPENVDEAVKDAFEDEDTAGALADAILGKLSPALGQSLAEALDQSTAGKFDAVDAAANKVAQALRKTAQDAFKDAMRTSFIPAFEAGCNNLLAQFAKAAESAKPQQSGAQSSNTSDPELARKLLEVQERQAAMESSLQRIENMLARTMHSSSMSTGSAPPATSGHMQQQQQQSPPPSVPSPNLGGMPPGAPASLHPDLMPLFNDILGYLNSGDYQSAFLKALSESNLDLVVATCNQVDPERVFAGAQGVALSQRVLLALVQQLSVDLLTDTPLKLQWMQRGAMALNPQDRDVGIHVSRVMNEVRNHMESQRQYVVQAENTGASPNRSLFEMCLNIVSSRAAST